MSAEHELLTLDEKATSLYELAKQIAQSGRENTGSEIAEICSAIVRYLHRADDEALLRALDIADLNEDEKTFSELILAIETQTEVVELPDAADSGGDLAYLFAIPIIVELPVSGFSGVVEHEEGLRKLERSISAAGLADGAPNIKILNYLYSTSELSNSKPSDIYQLAIDTAMLNRCDPHESKWNLLQWTRGSSEAETIRQSDVLGASRIDSNIVLRYLVGAYVTKAPIDPFRTAYEFGEDDPCGTQFHDSLEKWQIKAKHIIRECLGPSLQDRYLAVGAPDSFYLSMTIAEENYRQTLFILQMNETLTAKSLSIGAVKAIVVPFGRDKVSEIRVCLVSLLTGQMAGGMVYEMARMEDYDGAMTSLSYLLSINGIFSVDIVSEIHDPLDRRFMLNGFLSLHPEVSESHGFVDEIHRILH